jgi:hypothetical protein
MATNLSCLADSAQWQTATGITTLAASHKVNHLVSRCYGNSFPGRLLAILMAETRKQIGRITEFQ